jgi:hypothetical protein
MARSILKVKNLSNEYWTKVVVCVVYILNGCPTKSIRDKIPQQAWSGKYYSVSHF